MNEKWRELYTIEQIHKIQEIELENLKVLKEVCEKIGVDFFLYGGSLIGAVRHKGFVPWDDDLDIAMLRADYDKFIKEAPKYLPGQYYLQSPYNDKKSPYWYSKLRLKGTKCVEYGTHKLDIEHGIYVDIYPIDYMPDKEEEYVKKYNSFQKVVKLFVFRQCPYSGNQKKDLKSRIKKIIKYCISIFLKLIPHKLWIDKLDNIEKSYNNEKSFRFGNYSYFAPTNIFDKIVPFEKANFEGIEVNIPNSWEQHLSLRYGNYMEMPPLEERIGHKPYILDFGKYEEN